MFLNFRGLITTQQNILSSSQNQMQLSLPILDTASKIFLSSSSPPSTVIVGRSVVDMAMSTMKLTEFPLRNTKFQFPFPCYSHFLFSSSKSTNSLKLSLLKPFSSLRSTTTTTYGSTSTDNSNNPSSSSSSSTWLNNWSPPAPNPPTKPEPGGKGRQASSSGPTRTTPIDRIVLRLRNLGLGSDDDEEEGENEYGAKSAMHLTGEEKLGDLLRRDWVRPDKMLIEDEDEEEDETVLPWERKDKEEEERDRGGGKVKKRTAKAPTLAELTMEDAELRRLRRVGTTIRERISVAKAGVTAAVLEKIHDQWRKSELVRLKFHEELAGDMKTAHEIVEVG